MENKKMLLLSIVTGLCFCIFAVVAIILIVGAFRCASAIITNKTPTDIECVCMIFVSLIVGFSTAIFFYDDTKE